MSVGTILDLPINVLLSMPYRTIMAHCRVDKKSLKLCKDQEFWRTKAYYDLGVESQEFNARSEESPMKRYVNLAEGAPRNVATLHLITMTGEGEPFEKVCPGLLKDFERGDLLESTATGDVWIIDKDSDDGWVFYDIDYTIDGDPIPDSFDGLTQFPLDYWDPTKVKVNRRCVPSSQGSEFVREGIYEPVLLVHPADIGLDRLRKSQFRPAAWHDIYPDDEETAWYTFINYNGEEYMLVLTSEAYERVGNGSLTGAVGYLSSGYHYYAPLSRALYTIAQNRNIPPSHWINANLN